MIRTDTVSLYKPDITWYKLGHKIEDMFLSSEVKQIGNDLHFISLKPEFSGSYSCIALNKAGSDQIEFELSVRQSPLVELKPEKTVFQGKILTLVCDIKKGAPEPTLTWEKDGNVLASNSKEFGFITFKRFYENKPWFNIQYI